MAADKFTLEDGWLLQRERAVAWLRVAFALLAVVVIQLNPDRVALFPTLSVFSLGSFLGYSVIVLGVIDPRTDYDCSRRNLDRAHRFFHRRYAHAVFLLLFVPRHYRKYSLGAQRQSARRLCRSPSLRDGTVNVGCGIHGLASWDRYPARAQPLFDCSRLYIRLRQ